MDHHDFFAEYHDLWADLPEWENNHDPGQVLDWWREAAGVLAPLSKLVEGGKHEALQTAVYSAENRVAGQVRRWTLKVWGIVQENREAERLTPFGEILAPLLERADLTPRELLYEAGRIETPNAEEILMRHMYGPPTEVKGGYLAGWQEPLNLSDEERSTLSSALVGPLPTTSGGTQ